MPSIFVTGFGGKMPGIDARLIPDYAAQTATNCDIRTGSLAGVLGLTEISDLGVGITPKTIWKKGSSWIYFANGVEANVVNAIEQESGNRFFYSGDGFPKKSDDTVWALGTPYQRLGVKAPTAAPTITIQGAGDGETQAIITYVYTMVDKWGHESAPSPATGVTTIEGNQYVDLSDLNTPASSDNDYEFKNIYRIEAGVSGAQYFYLGQTAFANTTYQDKASGNALASATTDALATEGWVEPSATLSGLILGHNGIMAGYSGKEVFFSEPFIPYAYKTANSITLDTDVQGLGYANEQFVAISKTRPYSIIGSAPENMAVRKIDQPQTCASNRGVVGTPYGVLFPSNEGMCLVNGRSLEVITGRYIKPAQWQALTPSNLESVWHNEKYYGFFKTTALGIEIDPQQRHYLDFDLSGTVTSIQDVYMDASDDLIYLLTYKTGDTKHYIHSFDTNATSLAYTWKSKEFVDKNNYTCAKIKGPFGGTVTFKYYLDGSLVLTAAVTSDQLFRLPASGYKETKEFQISGSVGVDSVQLATNPQELI
jgi:hypothetical protein